MVLRFGHAYMMNAKTQQIVSGPIFEVLMEAELNDVGSIQLRPRPQSGVRMNTGDDLQCKDPTLVEELHHFFAEQEPLDMVPGDPSGSIHQLLDELQKRMSWNAKAMQTDEFLKAGAAVDKYTIVCSPAWCLYTRPSTTEAHSLDADVLADKLTEGKLKLPVAALGITHKPEVLKDRLASLKLKGKERHDTTSSGSPSAEGGDEPPAKPEVDKSTDSSVAPALPKPLVFPLPASDIQQKICEKLLVEAYPVCLARGPPGNDKTHTIANVIAIFLWKNKQTIPKEMMHLCITTVFYIGRLSESEGKRCLVQSLSNTALREVRERLPPKLRVLCVSCDGELHKSLEALEHALSSVEDSKWQYEEDLKRFEAELKSTQEKLCEIDADLQKGNDSKRRFIDSSKGQTLLGKLVETHGWMATAAVKWDATKLDGVVNRVRELAERPNKLNKTILGNGALKLDTEDGCLNEAMAVLTFQTDLSTFHAEAGADLIKFGCQKDEIYSKTGFISPKLLGSLESIRELMKSVTETETADFQMRGDGGLGEPCIDMEARRRELTAEIQKIALKVVEVKALLNLNNRISEDQRSDLTSFVGLARDVKFGPSSRAECQDHFKACASFLPCLMMTSEQVSQYLPATDHTFDLGILDEASQSRCTAITGLVRCNQWLFVGDGKQTSPCVFGGTTSDKFSVLAGMAPAIPPNIRRLLRPDYSIFDIFEVAFPKHASFNLPEHFRCAPEIIKWCNDEFYQGKLIPLRYPTKKEKIVPSLVDVRLEEGLRDKKTKTNEAEVNEIIRIVAHLLQTPLIAERRRSIGILSLGGEEQCRQLDKRLREKVGPHPTTFQGAERNIMSMVYSPESIFHGCDSDQSKRLNVGMSRGTDCTILVRSVDSHHFRPGNLRSSLIRFFNNANTNRPCEIRACLAPDAPPSSIRRKLTNNLAETLEKRGFAVESINVIWKHAFVVEHENSDHRVAVCFDNIGESRKEWESMISRQRVIERIGWTCLRVDGLSVLMDYEAAMQGILKFLADAGVHVEMKTMDTSAQSSGPTDISSIFEKVNSPESSASAGPPSLKAKLEMTEEDQLNSGGNKRSLDSSLESTKRQRN
ncbi:Inherit from COG: Helicase [Seminavis robusta]|uniref:Inherit from COG: Helicase n=1 Tax=Seminavis robusta TaxID=568900 RepID=A0A9N8DZ53_9STRA|nr:Inherit from COG: Helicase [Seminavis robusta]